MSRLRTPLVVALVVSVLGAGAALVMPDALAMLEASRREQAYDEARSVAPPEGATPSMDCPGQGHGDGIVACWQSDGTVPDVTRVLQESMEGRMAEPIERVCIPALGPPAPKPPRGSVGSCVLALRHGDRHGVFVFVDPRIGRDGADDGPVVTGSVVTVAAN
ncbi:hypothetical protein [Cellulomonas sp. URHB0016]